jgi:hypothetical protein
MSRRKPKSAEAKRNIKKGLQAYWEKKGKKHAAIVAGLGVGVTTAAVAGRQGTPILKKTMIAKLSKLDAKMGESLRNTVYDSVTGKASNPNPLVEALMNSQTVKGTKEGLAQGIKDKVAMEQQKATNAVKARVETTIKTPQRTAEAFKAGLNVKPANENDASVNRGKTLARIYKRAKSDTKKVFGFKQVNTSFSFEPQDAERHPRLIEFAKRKKAPKAKKPLSAAHKAKISAGLQEYYDSIPKKEETLVDKGEKVSKSIGRIARSAKTFAEAASVASTVYEKFKKPEVRQGIGAGILTGIGIVSSLSGSARDFGSAARSLAGAADLVHDLASGSKKKRESFRESSLQAKRDANKTNRQVHAVRARLERNKARLKDKELNIKSSSVNYYGTLVNAAAKAGSKGGHKYEDARTRRGKFTGALPDWD